MKLINGSRSGAFRFKEMIHMGLLNLVDKLVDSASDKIIETVVEVQTKTPYLLGKYTKPTPESLKEMEKFVEEFIDFKNP